MEGLPLDSIEELSHSTAGASANGKKCFLQSLNFGLDETLIALRDSVAAFCAKEITPIAQQVDQNNEFPAQLWKKFGDMGLLGLTVSEELAVQV